LEAFRAGGRIYKNKKGDFVDKFAVFKDQAFAYLNYVKEILDRYPPQSKTRK